MKRLTLFLAALIVSNTSFAQNTMTLSDVNLQPIETKLFGTEIAKLQSRISVNQSYTSGNDVDLFVTKLNAQVVLFKRLQLGLSQYFSYITFEGYDGETGRGDLMLNTKVLLVDNTHTHLSFYSNLGLPTHSSADPLNDDNRDYVLLSGGLAVDHSPMPGMLIGGNFGVWGRIGDENNDTAVLTTNLYTAFAISPIVSLQLGLNIARIIQADYDDEFAVSIVPGIRVQPHKNVSLDFGAQVAVNDNAELVYLTNDISGHIGLSFLF